MESEGECDQVWLTHVKGKCCQRRENSLYQILRLKITQLSTVKETLTLCKKKKKKKWFFFFFF